MICLNNSFTKTKIIGLLLAASSFLGITGSSLAEVAFPNKPMKMIVPYPPGGSTDNLARVFTQELSRVAGVPVVVDNKPGGGTTVGAINVRNSPADGYTLLFQVDGLFNGKLSSSKIPYEFEDFEIIAPLSQTPYALLTPARLNIRSIDDLKALAQKKNGEITIGTLGIGVSSYSIMGNTLAKAIGVKPVFIPYKGGAQGVNALMVGDIDVYFATVGLTRSLEGNDKVNILASTGNSGENKFLKGVPAFVDHGIEDLQFLSLYGVAIRANTPQSIKDQLRKLLNEVTTSDAMRRAREQVSLEDYPGDLNAYLRDIEKNIQMYKDAYAQQNTDN